MNWVKHLFRHRHVWWVTHTNRWQHSTREHCPGCGMTREIQSTGFGTCKWVYSDGTESEEMEWGKQ